MNGHVPLVTVISAVMLLACVMIVLLRRAKRDMDEEYVPVRVGALRRTTQQYLCGTMVAACAIPAFVLMPVIHLQLDVWRDPWISQYRRTCQLPHELNGRGLGAFGVSGAVGVKRSGNISSWPKRIPPLLHFSSARLTPKAHLQRNVHNTEALFQHALGGKGVTYRWGDARCRAAAVCSGLSYWEAFVMLTKMYWEPYGPYRSDLCRYAFLHAHGGLYVDDDIHFVEPLSALLRPKDRLVSVWAPYATGLFQSFLAVESRHPKVRSTLAAACALSFDIDDNRLELQRAFGVNDVTAAAQFDSARKDGTRILAMTGLRPDSHMRVIWPPPGTPASCEANCVVRDSPRATKVLFYAFVAGHKPCDASRFRDGTLSGPLEVCVDANAPADLNGPTPYWPDGPQPNSTGGRPGVHKVHIRLDKGTSPIS